MATYYVDPIGGNDASAGTSFATRLQTITGASNKSLVAGDTIRVIASADATNMGQNATWTDGSNTVALTTAVTADISQSTGTWTASANVTTTTSTNRKLGATSSSISPAAAFTTGKAAYLALGSAQNFSAYQQVSFWINMTAGTMAADGDITLRLCSDTTGDVTVNTISIPRIRATSTWQAYTVDLGTNLGSSIQSIALYVAVDNGAQTFLINNILACKASSAADSLSLTSLFGKNTGSEPWLPILNISGTTITLSPYQGYNLSTTNVISYSGTTETVAIWKREPIKLPSSIVATSTSATTFGAWTKSGVAGNVITISGGWNTTDMSTQTGDTYISGVNGFGYAFSTTVARYLSISKLNFNSFDSAYQMYSDISITADNLCNNTRGLNLYTTGLNVTTNIVNACCNGYGVTANTSPNNGFNSSINFTNVNSNHFQGIGLTSGAGLWTINATNVNRNATGVVLQTVVGCNITMTNCNYNVTANVSFNAASSNNITITGQSNTNNTNSGGIAFAGGVSNNKIVLTGATLTSAGSNTYYHVTTSTSAYGANNQIIGGTFTGNGTSAYLASSNGVVNVIFDSPTFTAGTFNSSYITSIVSFPVNVIITRYNSSANATFGYTGPGGGYYSTSTSPVHTPGGTSWALRGGPLYSSSTFAPTSSNPFNFPVATVAVNSGTLVTASVWVYIVNSASTVKFFTPGDNLMGVALTSTTANSVTTGSWQQLTLTFTPSAQGVIPFYVQYYDSTVANIVYVDDFSVSQA